MKTMTTLKQFTMKVLFFLFIITGCVLNLTCKKNNPVESCFTLSSESPGIYEIDTIDGSCSKNASYFELYIDNMLVDAGSAKFYYEFESTGKHTIKLIAYSSFKGSFNSRSGCSDCKGAGKSSIAEKEVYVTPMKAPIITSNSPVAYGEYIYLSTDFVNDAEYTWTGPNGFTSNNQSVSIYANTAKVEGTYSLVIKKNNSNSTPGIVDVKLGPLTASCTSENNTCHFGTSIYNINQVNTSILDYENMFVVSASSSNINFFNLYFKGKTKPCTGIYNIVGQYALENDDDVNLVNESNSNTYNGWFANGGKVYLTVSNGNISAIICGSKFQSGYGAPYAFYAAFSQ